MPRFSLSLLLLALFGPAIIRAADINWNSSIGASNYTSVGAPASLGADFIFELGAFSGNFVPTAANTGQWATHWIAVDREGYNPRIRFFSSKATLANNAPPFQFGKRAYIWGFNQTSPGEWILFTNAAWNWPFAGGGIEPPLTWSVGASGTTAIVGAVNTGGVGMRTALVSGTLPPKVKADAWTQQYFTLAERLDPSISSLAADPDGDGVCNLCELAVGSDPRKAGGPLAPVVEMADNGAGGKTMQIRLPRTHRADIRYGAEASPDLRAWSSSGLSVVSDTPEEITFRCLPGSLPRMFMRLTFAP